MHTKHKIKQKKLTGSRAREENLCNGKTARLRWITKQAQQAVGILYLKTAVAIDEKVSWFDVPMNDPHGMEVLHT